MKKLSIAFIAVGILMAAAALVLPLVMIGQGGASTGIIGGAGWPTYWLLFSNRTGWLAFIGVVLAVVGCVFRLAGRRNKN